MREMLNLWVGLAVFIVILAGGAAFIESSAAAFPPAQLTEFVGWGGFVVTIGPPDRPVTRDANHLAVTFQDGDHLPMLSFVADGVLHVVPAQDVISIELLSTGVTRCHECTQALPAE